MYDITLDTNKGGFQAVLEGFKLGDTKTRSVVIRLMSGLKPYSLPIKEDGSADYTATLYIKGATATHYSECTAYADRIEHTFLTSEIEAGESECEIRIIGSGGETLTSARFKIYAEAVLQNDAAIEATDTYSALDKALADVKNAQTGLDTKMPKVPGAVKDRIAVFDSDGNVAESAYDIDEIGNVDQEKSDETRWKRVLFTDGGAWGGVKYSDKLQVQPSTGKIKVGGDVLTTVSENEKAAWNGKQDALTAGENITIENNVISAAGGSSKSFVLEYKSEYSESEETALAAKLVEIAADTSNAPVYIKDNNNIIPAAVYRRSKIRADVSAVHQNDISSAVYIISNYPGLQYSKSNLYVGDMLSGSLSTAAAPTCFAAALYTATQFVEGYELIATVTTTEAANQVVIDTDAAGNAFALDAAWLFAEVPAGTAGVVYVRYDDAEATKIVSMQVTNAINTAARYWNSRLENHRGMWELVQTAGASTAGSVNTSSRPAGLIGLANVGIASVKAVKSAAQIPAGTKLTLYGIRRVIPDA